MNTSKVARQTLRASLFHLLYGFRKLVRFVLRTVLWICMTGIVIELMLKFNHNYVSHRLIFIVAALGIVAYALLWIYDRLILKLKPDDVQLLLFR